MIKQKYSRKVVAQNKRRTSFFQFMNDVKKQFGLQARINAKQVQLNTNQIITNEEILARLGAFSQFRTHCVACAKSAAKTKCIPPFLGLDIGQISPKEPS